MPLPPSALPDSLGDEFAAGEAISAGVTRRRLRAKDLDAPFRGVRRRSSVRRTREQEDAADAAPYPEARRLRRRVLEDARAYAKVRPEGSFICGRSAAVILGAPIAHPGPLEVSTIAPKHAPHGAGVSGRKISPALVSTFEYAGLPLSSPASTWAMLCRDLDERDLIVLGDWMVHVPRDEFGRKQPQQALATIDELTAAAHSGPRPPRTHMLRSAVTRVAVGSASPLETKHRLNLQDAGLPMPELDGEIRDINGRLLGISEFVYRRYGVVTEVEGDHHRTSRAQWNRDIAKYRAYEAKGLTVVRLTSANIQGRSRDDVALVGDALHRRGWRP